MSPLRLHCTFAVVLVAVASLRIASTYQVFSHTIDEPHHLAAGMEWLTIRKYRYEDQHPPLARVFAALGPFISGERWRGGSGSYREGYRILGRNAGYDRMLALGRLGMLPFFWIACVAVFFWAHRAAGLTAASVALLLFTTLPPVLAHASLMTTDMAAAAFISAAFLASLSWARQPDRRHTIIFGGLFALALLSKFSAVGYLPVAWLLTFAVQRGSLTQLRSFVRPAALSLLVAALVIWAAYWFSFARVDALHCRLPAPRFFSGIHAVWEHQQAGHPSYLLGQRSPSGFWYYYPVVLFIKTPLAMLLLAAAALWAAPRRSLAAFTFVAAILLVACPSRINIGVRHVLPVYVALSVAAGAAAVALWTRPAFRPVVVVLLAWHVLSGAVQHPDYLAYTNEIAGREPERWIADSDLDWGQDMKRLANRLSRAGVTELTFTPFDRAYAFAGHSLPQTTPGNSAKPSPGWNAVSITTWKTFGFPAWADRAPAPERVGRSILLWHFPEAHQKQKTR